MRDSIWHLDAAQAGLASPSFEARLDLAVPADGLRHVRVGGADWPAARVLGFEWGPGDPIAPNALLECVVRSDDLMASYGETADRPVRVDAMWRFGRPAPEPGLLAAVDLVLSVHTSLLESRPALFARSRLAAGEVIRLADVPSGRFCPVESSPGAPPVTFSEDEPSCLVFRPSGESTSYVEMVHPADFPRDGVRCPAGTDAPVEVCHELFTRPLEKGVVLRSRVRGMWVARDGDLPAAVEGYRSFAASEPPLGS